MNSIVPYVAYLCVQCCTDHDSDADPEFDPGSESESEDELPEIGEEEKSENDASETESIDSYSVRAAEILRAFWMSTWFVDRLNL